MCSRVGFRGDVAMAVLARDASLTNLVCRGQTATAARSACHTPSKSSGLEQVTNFGGFTSFPEFSPDGKTLVFCSDKDAKERYEFNIFTAKWGK